MSYSTCRMTAPRQFPQIPGFDLDAGPEGLEDPRRVRASRRRGALRWRADEEQLPEYLRSEKLDREFLNTLTATLGPAARSGEDLPPLGPGQVQLAGFCATQTVHCECWSLSAYRGKSRIRYHFSDEGDPDGLNGSRLALQTTTAWPSLGKLIWMIDNSDFSDGYTGLYFAALVEEVREQSAEPASLIGDIEVYSHFYPQLSGWYDAAVRVWARKVEQSGDVESGPDSIELMAQHYSAALEVHHE